MIEDFSAKFSLSTVLRKFFPSKVSHYAVSWYHHIHTARPAGHIAYAIVVSQVRGMYGIYCTEVQGCKAPEGWGPCFPSVRDITSLYPKAAASVPRNALHLAAKFKSTIVTTKEVQGWVLQLVQVAVSPSLLESVTIHSTSPCFSLVRNGRVDWLVSKIAWRCAKHWRFARPENLDPRTQCHHAEFTPPTYFQTRPQSSAHSAPPSRPRASTHKETLPNTKQQWTGQPCTPKNIFSFLFLGIL